VYFSSAHRVHLLQTAQSTKLIGSRD
jgi:hypothetical protein